MNIKLLAFGFILLLASCSQQRYSFRKTIPVDSKTQVTQKEKRKNPLPSNGETAIALNPSEKIVDASSAPTVVEPQTQKQDPIVASTENVVPKKVVPEWKENREQRVELQRPLETKDNKKAMERKNGYAVAGFVLSLIGLFVFPIIFCTLGIIFSAIGIKSDKRGLAIAGLVIGIIGFVLWLVLVALVV